MTIWPARLAGRVRAWLDRPPSPEDQAKIDTWVRERREHDANLAFTPDAERDIGNPDPRPPAPHQSRRRPRRMPGANLRRAPRHAGRPDQLEDR